MVLSKENSEKENSPWIPYRECSKIGSDYQSERPREATRSKGKRRP